MSFFDKLLKGLGFEEEEQIERPRNIKKEKNKRVTAKFNLNSSTEAIEHNDISKKIDDKIQPVNNNTSVDILVVKNQIDIQSVINKLKNGQKALINVGDLNAFDLIRSLDFLTGAVYALGLSMQKVDTNIYLIQ